ncbi:MAG: hypothetical protein HY898_27115 [Deltaproteobacteria bacterium]|nr:hypothetical protein [Deltaproteobacteria bacterium]
MRSIALALLLAALLVVQISLHASGVDSLLIAPVSVVIGVAAAIVAQGGISWIAVALGAGSSLAFGWLDGWSPVFATAAMCLLWLAPRVWLARTKADLIVGGATALGASALCAVVLVRYASEPLVMHVASCVFAGAALAMATLAGRSDTPLLHALRVASRAARGPARESLEKVVMLMAQRDEAGVASAKRSFPRGQLRRIARLADQLIAQQDFQGEDALRAREQLEARLSDAIKDLQAGQAPKPPATPSASPAPAADEAPPQSPTTEPASPSSAQAAEDSSSAPIATGAEAIAPIAQN